MPSVPGHPRRSHHPRSPTQTDWTQLPVGDLELARHAGRHRHDVLALRVAPDHPQGAQVTPDDALGTEVAPDDAVAPDHALPVRLPNQTITPDDATCPGLLMAAPNCAIAPDDPVAPQDAVAPDDPHGPGRGVLEHGVAPDDPVAPDHALAPRQRL